MNTLHRFGFKAEVKATGEASYVPTVNAPPPLRGDVQLTALPLHSEHIRALLRKLFFQKPAEKEGDTLVKELIKSYLSEQSQHVQNTLKQQSYNVENELKFSLVFALEDLVGRQMIGQSKGASGSHRSHYKDSAVLVSLFRHNRPHPHFESYIRTGNLSTPPPTIVSVLRQTDDGHVLDTSDPSVRTIVSEIFSACASDDLPLAYAFMIQLRDLAARRYLGSTFSEERQADSVTRGASTIVAKSLIQILGAEQYVSRGSGYMADHGSRLNTQSLAPITQLVRRRRSPHPRFTTLIQPLEASPTKLLAPVLPRTVPAKTLRRNTLKSLALDAQAIIARAEVGHRDEVNKFFNDVFDVLLDEGQGGMGILHFKPTELQWDITVANNPAAARAELTDYLKQQVTEVMPYFADAESANSSLDVFNTMWLGRASDRSIQTAYAALAGGVDVTPTYLQAVEAMSDTAPLPATHGVPMIYFKCAGDHDGNDVLQAVAENSNRLEVSSWASRALAPSPPLPETVNFLQQLWGGQIPFPLRSQNTLPYQIGRSSSTLAARIQLEELYHADTRKDPAQYSRWNCCVHAAENPTKYRPLFLQEGLSPRRELLEQQAGELFGALVFRCPRSTTMQVPALDLRGLDHLADTDASSSTDNTAASELKMIDADADGDVELGSATIPTIGLPRIDLMTRWRRILGERLTAQGYSYGEVELEILHYLGFRGEDVRTFLADDEVFLPHGICRGLNKPFNMSFTASSGRLRCSTNFFVVGLEPDSKELCLRPGAFADQPRLPRPPDYPRRFVGSRIPVELAYALTVSAHSTAPWKALYEAAKSEAVIAKVVLTLLPGGGIGMALPGDGPKTHALPFAFSNDPSVPLTFWEPRLTAEARSLLLGVFPGKQKVHELDLFNYVSPVAAHQVGPNLHLPKDIPSSPTTEQIRSQLSTIVEHADSASEEGQKAILDLTHLFSTIGLNADLAHVIAGVSLTWKLLMCCIPYFVIERFGRRKLFMVSGAGMAMCMFVLAICGSQTTKTNLAPAYVAIVFVFLFLIFLPLAYLGVNFLYCQEVISTRYRAPAGGISTAVLWLTQFVIALTTPLGLQVLSWRYYLIWGCVAATIVPVVYFWYPETTGLSMEELEDIWTVPGGLTAPVREARRLRAQKAEKRFESGISTPVVVEEKQADLFVEKA